MGLVTPRGYTTHPGDRLVQVVSFMVQPSDDFTEKKILNGLAIYLEEDRQRRPVRNASGDYCFLDLPAGTYTVSVRFDASAPGYYFSKKATVTVPAGEPQEPVVTIQLTPTPSYPFPSCATLIRGKVTRGGTDPIAGAEVTATYTRVDETSEVDLDDEEYTIVTATDSGGHYVLYFTKLYQDTETIDVFAAFDGETKTVEATYEEGIPKVCLPIEF